VSLWIGGRGGRGRGWWLGSGKNVRILSGVDNLTSFSMLNQSSNGFGRKE